MRLHCDDVLHKIHTSDLIFALLVANYVIIIIANIYCKKQYSKA